MRTKAMRLSGKLQMAKNRKHYCRPVLKSCDFHFGVGHLLEQRLGHGCAWAEGQRCTVPKSHVHACFKTLLEFAKSLKSCLVIHALRLESGPFLTSSLSQYAKFCSSVRLGFGSIIHTVRMNHLVFHILPKIVRLQSDSNHQQQGP